MIRCDRIITYFCVFLMNNLNRFDESSKNSCNILLVFQVIPIPSFPFQLKITILILIKETICYHEQKQVLIFMDVIIKINSLCLTEHFIIYIYFYCGYSNSQLHINTHLPNNNKTSHKK